MNRVLLLSGLATALALLAATPASALSGGLGPIVNPGPPAIALQTSLIDPLLLEAGPTPVTDAQLTTVGASPATQQLSNDPNQLVVDDDLAQCPNANFTTAAGIQLAIEAAAPGTK